MRKVIPPLDTRVETGLRAGKVDRPERVEECRERYPECQPDVHRDAVIAFKYRRQIGYVEIDERVDGDIEVPAVEADEDETDEDGLHHP